MTQQASATRDVTIDGRVVLTYTLKDVNPERWTAYNDRVLAGRRGGYDTYYAQVDGQPVQGDARYRSIEMAMHAGFIALAIKEFSPGQLEPGELHADPARLANDYDTGIFVRAKTGIHWESVDIAELDIASLQRWLRSRGGKNIWAENTVALLLGHPSSALIKGDMNAQEGMGQER